PAAGAGRGPRRAPPVAPGLAAGAGRRDVRRARLIQSLSGAGGGGRRQHAPLNRVLRDRKGVEDARTDGPARTPMSAHLATGRVILDDEQVARTLRRIAHELVEKHADLDQLALVGIYTRGAVLAERLRGLVEQFTERSVPTGALDISFYRDDVRVHPQPVVK